jgi:hypothetical protein
MGACFRFTSVADELLSVLQGILAALGGASEVEKIGCC